MLQIDTYIENINIIFKIEIIILHEIRLWKNIKNGILFNRKNFPIEFGLSNNYL